MPRQQDCCTTTQALFTFIVEMSRIITIDTGEFSPCEYAVHLHESITTALQLALTKRVEFDDQETQAMYSLIGFSDKLVKGIVLQSPARTSILNQLDVDSEE